MDKIVAYKGFNKDLQCRDYQYEVGGEYQTEKAKACQTGFHCCENPFDVWTYYPPCNMDGTPNRFCEVEPSGEFDRSGSDKICSTQIKINAEIGLQGLIKAGVKFILDRVKSENKQSNTGYRSAATNTGNCSAATNTGYRSAATNTGDCSAATNTGDYSAATNTGYCSAATNTGYYSAATNTGYCSAATNTGYRSAATNTGDYSAATNTGNQSAATNTGNQSAATNTGNQSAATNTGNRSAALTTGYKCSAIAGGRDTIAIAAGKNNRAKGCIGAWLVLVERDENNGTILNIQSVKVDGVKVKEDTFYFLENNEIKEYEK